MPRTISASFSFAPLRRRIAASVWKDATEELITDLCMLVASIAHGRQQVWLDFMGEAKERLMLDSMAHAQKDYAREIQQIRDLTVTLTAAGRVLGLADDEIRVRIDTLICRDLFAFPA